MKMESEKLLVALSSAVSYTFKEDAVCPGVLVSTLKDGSIYASVVRYNVDGKGKKVVCKTNAISIPDAIKQLSKAFLDLPNKRAKNPIDTLSDLIGKP